MTCVPGCKVCTSQDQTELSIVNPSYPASAAPGDTVTISFGIQNNTPGAGGILGCLYDTSTGSCLYAANPDIGPYGTWTFGPWTLTMPSRNLNLSISAINVWPGGILNICNDFLNFTIEAVYPPGSLCTCTNGNCIQGPSGNMDCQTCVSTCSGGTFGTCPQGCPTGDMCVMGTCIPRPMVFLGFGLIALYMMSKG